MNDFAKFLREMYVYDHVGNKINKNYKQEEEDDEDPLFKEKMEHENIIKHFSLFKMNEGADE